MVQNVNMAKSVNYACTECGATSTKWSGQCDGCQAWNTLVEEKPLAAGPGKKSLGARRGKAIELTDLATVGEAPPRTLSGVGELDRVLGGGLVKASAILVGGDPGIGKSTLLLQAAARFGRNGLKVVWADHVDSAPGSVSQVRTCAHELTTFAKTHNIAMVMVGHVTKEGAIAGPRVVEHMVDTVLYFEGERGHQFRILRSVKNRFGPAAKGWLRSRIPQPFFCPNALLPPVLWSLVSQPRRSVVGWDGGRLAMILAVLESRCGVPFTGLDVYLNVAGGLRITEPAADLAVAAALVSAREDAALPKEAVVFGEISLSGALRPVVQTENRLKEAAKLGFTSAITPQQTKKVAASGLTLRQPQDLAGFVEDVFGER